MALLRAALFYMVLFPWLQERPYQVSYQKSSTEFFCFSSPIAKVRRRETHKHLRAMTLPRAKGWSVARKKKTQRRECHPKGS